MPVKQKFLTIFALLLFGSSAGIAEQVGGSVRLTKQQALRYSAVRGNRPDVTLSVKIVHRRGFDQPVDDCEMRCLKEMKAHLAELGACERQWSLRKPLLA